MDQSAIPDEAYKAAVTRLRELFVEIKSYPEIEQIVEVRDEVLERFQPVFSKSHLPNLMEEEFRAFLRFSNNRHWTGLERLGPRICGEMDRLRAALDVLHDNDRSIKDRVDEAVGNVPGMGKAIVTAILQIAYPREYGVWNRVSEEGLKALDIWPNFERAESIGGRYEKINPILLALANDLQTDLWTLDALWWAASQDRSSVQRESPDGHSTAFETNSSSESQVFGLERHLHEFLRDNWRLTSLGRDWALHSEPGDDEAGYEYPCGVGRIDLLARHRTEPKWLVVELKRDQSSDTTVGQILRYIGWVRQHLASPGEDVYGLVIARSADDSMRYALSTVPNVDLQFYEVEFRLKSPNSLS